MNSLKWNPTPSALFEGEEKILKNDAYFESLLSDISAAKESIDMEVYIFTEDIAGREIADALCAAAERGVHIRILVDGIGTPFWGSGITKKMEKCGIKTRIFHPLPFIISHWGRAAHVPVALIKKIIYLLSNCNSRNHRKIGIIDHQIVYVSSANIISYHLKKEKGGEEWRDTTVRLSHIDTTYLQVAFEKVWHRFPFRKKLKIALKQHPIFNLNYSWYQRRYSYKTLLSKIRSAKKRIWITNAYFVPDIFLLKALCKAAKHGIDIRILLPHQSDVLITSLVAKTFYSILLNSGISIYEYLPSMLHAKILIIDDFFSVGSSNLNSRSFWHDLEINVNIQTEESKKILEEQFLADLKHSQQIDFNYLKKQSWIEKMMGRLLLFFRQWM